MSETIPRHIVWSTDAIDLTDPFQRQWYIHQVILYGRASDIQTLDLAEVSGLLNDFHLPTHLDRLWRTFLETKGYA